MGPADFDYENAVQKAIDLVEIMKLDQITNKEKVPGPVFQTANR